MKTYSRIGDKQVPDLDGMSNKALKPAMKSISNMFAELSEACTYGGYILHHVSEKS